MKYLLAIYADEAEWAELGEDDRQAMYVEYARFAEDMGRRGMMIDGAELRPTTAATTVRVRDGRTLVTDGPFAETKEQLGGYFVVECESIDDAIEAAGRMPTARQRVHRGAAIGGAVGASEAAAAAFREHWGRAVAALMRRFGDADLAEESVQEAFGRAAARWPADGVPGSPLGWIVATAGNVAVDRLRRERALRERLPRLAAEPAAPEPEAFEEDDAVPDERLELIFTCCHPALSAEASVALTLRLVAGLTTAEIARAFLVPEAAMAQRLVRAKAKIRMAGIPFGRPPGHLLADRLDHTAAVLYLVFNEGYSASSGDDLVRRDLCDESIRLARLLVAQLPAEPEARGLLALMLLHHARSAARTTAAGEMVLLEHQDRSRWDAAMIRSGRGRAAPGAAGRRARPLPAAGRDRRAARPRRELRGHRLGAGGRALRRAGRDRPVAGRRPEPRGGGVDGRGPGARARARRRPGRLRRA